MKGKQEDDDNFPLSYYEHVYVLSNNLLPGISIWPDTFAYFGLYLKLILYYKITVCHLSGSL